MSDNDNAPEGQSVFGTPDENAQTTAVIADGAPAPKPFDVEDIDLSRTLILSAPDAKMKRHPVPEWGGYVWIKDMGGEGRDEFEVATTMQGDTNLRNVRAKLLSVCLCDKDGNRLFTAEDVDALGKKSAAVIARLYNEASRLNFVSDKDVEELAKNSESGATSIT